MKFASEYKEVSNVIDNDIRLFLSIGAQADGPWSEGFLMAAFEMHDKTPHCEVFTPDYANTFLMG